MDGIGKKKPGQFVAGGLLLGLNGRVALHLGLGHKREEREHELVCLGYRRVGEDHGLLRVDAAGEVVDDHVEHVVLDVLGRVAVGDHLVVCDDDVRADAHFLQAHAVYERSEVVAEVQTAGRAVAGEHGVLAGVDLELLVDLVAAAKRRLVASLVGHMFSFYAGHIHIGLYGTSNTRSAAAEARAC